MSKYMEILGAAADTATGGAVGTGQSIVKRATQSSIMDPTRAPLEMKEIAFSVLGGLGGAMLWKKHPVLGFLGGAAVGSSVEPMMRGMGNDRTDAAYRVGIVGAGIAASLHFKKHPALAYAGGALGAMVVSSYVNGSPMNRLAKRLEG